MGSGSSAPQPEPRRSLCLKYRDEAGERRCLLDLLLEALDICRENADIEYGPREKGAVDDLVRATRSELLLSHEETIQSQLKKIEALERKKVGTRAKLVMERDSSVSKQASPPSEGSFSQQSVFSKERGMAGIQVDAAVQVDLFERYELASPKRVSSKMVQGDDSDTASDTSSAAISRVSSSLAVPFCSSTADADAEVTVLRAVSGRSQEEGGGMVRTNTARRKQGRPKSTSFCGTDLFTHNRGLSKKGSRLHNISHLRRNLQIFRQAATNISMYKEMEKLRASLDALTKVIHDVAMATFDSDTVIPKLLGTVRGIFSAECCSLYKLDERTGKMRDEVLMSLMDGRTVHSSSGNQETLKGIVARETLDMGEVTCLSDCTMHERFNSDNDSNVKSLIAVPIHFEQNAVAALLVENCAVDGHRLDVAEAFAALAGVSLRGSRLFRKAVFQQKKSDAMLKTAHALAVSDLDGTELPSVIMRNARALGNADRCALFIVDHQRDELAAYYHSRSGETDVLVMPMASDISGHVAATGQPVILDDAYSDPRFNREIDRLLECRTRSLLCLPVTYENRVVAVAQLINKIGANTFDDDEIEMFESFAAFAGVSLRNSFHYQSMLRQRRMTELILNIVRNLSESDIRNIDNVAEKVLVGAQELCSADRCALFLVDEEHHQLYAKVATEGSNKQEIRMRIGQGIAGLVARDGKFINIPNAYEDKRFNTEVDKQTGYRTQSILAYPIHHQKQVVAVAQLINKKDQHGRVCGFEADDEQLLESFAAFAGISIGNARLYSFVVEAGNQAMELFDMQMGVSLQKKHRHGLVIPKTDLVKRLVSTTVPKDRDALLITMDFPIHSFSDSHADLIPYIVSMFHRLQLIDRFSIDVTKLVTLLCSVKDMYRKIPYHNFCHAFDVTQTLFLFLNMGVRPLLTDLDVLSLMLIGLLHDVDHMGLNNSFHLKAETPLGLLFSASGTQSVLEVHHCSVALSALQHEGMNVLSSLSEAEEKTVLKTMVNAILGTDMAKHAEMCRAYADIQATFDPTSFDHRKVLMIFLTKMADVSNVCKPFNISRDWARNLTREFKGQGDYEKQENLPVTFNLPSSIHRDLMTFSQGQVGFSTNIVLPMMELAVKQVPSLEPFREQLLKNRDRWKRISTQSIVAHTLGCGSTKGLLFIYYHKLAAWSAASKSSRGVPIDLLAHISGGLDP